MIVAMIRPETEMKDSGVKYIGLIPRTWKIVQLKYCTDCLDGKRVPIDASLRKSGIYPYWGAGKIMDYVDDYIFDERLVLLGEDGAPFFDDFRPVSHLIDGKIWVNNHIHVLRTKDNVVDSYLVHALNSVDYHEYINGSILNKLTQSNMNRIKIPLPSYIEQQAIANYLDEKCSKIDEIIAEAKASIDEYKTFKQALIAEITTNGLNKNIDFCETNFAWMGKIPSHWELKPFKYILNERNEKNNPIKSTERLSLSIDKGITLYAEKTTNLDRFKDDFTAYKLAYKGDLVMNSMNMIVGASGVSDYFGCVSPVYYTYFDNEPDHITAKYCEYLFRSRMLMRVLRSLGRGIHHIDRGDDRVNTCRLKVSRDDLRTLVLPVPPLCEQRDIVSFLDKRTTEIDSLISEKESLINDLEAYKKSLIYEVVTGKRRVV